MSQPTQNTQEPSVNHVEDGTPKKKLNLVGGIIFAAVVAIMVASFSLLSAYRAAKASYTHAVAAQGSLREGRVAFFANDMEKSLGHVNKASASLRASLSSLQKSRTLRFFPSFRSQYTAASSLISDGLSVLQVSERALEKIDDIIRKNNIDTTGIANLSREQKRSVLEDVLTTRPILHDLAAAFEKMTATMDEIKAQPLVLPKIKNTVSNVQEDAKMITTSLAFADDMFDFIGVLAGYPNPSRVLVLLQNNRELRATGGHIGHAALLEIDSAQVKIETLQNVFNAKSRSAVSVPPLALQKYLKTQTWNFQDANWSPVFAESAAQSVNIFRANNPAEGKIDFVVAVTPEFVGKVLQVGGPLQVDSEVYVDANFVDSLEYVTRDDPKRTEAQRQAFIKDFFTSFVQYVEKMPYDRWHVFLSAVVDSLSSKDVLLFHSDDTLENVILSKQWGGEIPEHNGDSVFVVDSNVGGNKADAAIKRSIEYDFTETAEGLSSRVTLHYEHQGLGDKKIGTYKAYTRIYIPMGSQVRLIRGFQADPGQKADNAVFEEYGRAVVAGYFEVGSGQKHDIVIEYSLPQSVMSLYGQGKYSLLLQKQAGVTPDVIIRFRTMKKITGYSPSASSIKVSKNELHYSFRPTRDIIMTLDLK